MNKNILFFATNKNIQSVYFRINHPYSLAITAISMLTKFYWFAFIHRTKLHLQRLFLLKLQVCNIHNKP